MVSSLFSRSSSPSAADIALKAEEQHTYVKELWLILTGVIGLLTLINAFRYILRLASSPRSKASNNANEKGSPEAFTPGRTGKASLRRLPATIASLFNVIAFRTTVPIGPSAVASVTELTFTLGYIVVMLVWLFVDSKTNSLSDKSTLS